MDPLSQSHPLGIFRKVLQAYWCSWQQQSSCVPFHGHFSLSVVKHDCYHCARFSFSHRTNIQPFKFHYTLCLTVRSMFRLLQEHTWSVQATVITIHDCVEDKMPENSEKYSLQFLRTRSWGLVMARSSTTVQSEISP